MALRLIGLARPLRADFSEVNQVKFEHDRVDRAISKSIFLSLQEFSIGGASRARGAKKPRAKKRSTSLVVGGRKRIEN